MWSVFVNEGRDLFDLIVVMEDFVRRGAINRSPTATKLVLKERCPFILIFKLNHYKKFKLMKRFSILFSLFFAALFFTGCMDDDCTQEVTYMKYTPVYLSTEELRKDISMESAREMESTGRIYFYNNLIFINEPLKGVHVIDNANPSHPQNIGFLPILGNTNLVIKNGQMYADSYVDLVTLDISNIHNIHVVSRIENTFSRNYHFVEGEGIAIDYTAEEVTEIIDCNENYNCYECYVNFDRGIAPTSNGGGGVLNQSAPQIGTGGSFAGFSIFDDYIYSIAGRTIKVFDISNPNQAEELEEVIANEWTETAYVYNRYLFIGGQTGMSIYDLSNPSSPNRISGYSHQTGCDPVAVYGNYAYVTIRSGNTCQGLLNQMDVLDISDILNPSLEESFEMDNPHGLAVNHEAVFLCEGEHGIKVFDNSDPLSSGNNLLSHFDDLDAFDVIIVPNQQNVMLLIGQDGLYQYDISDPENLVELSRLSTI